MIPENRLVPISSIELSFDAGPHPWLGGREAVIAANWADEKSANPALFNGPIIMHRDIRLDGETVCGQSHKLTFDAFLYWRKYAQNDPDIFHLFGVPVMVGSDGGMILGRMAPHTANAGQVYFPSGSLDADDISGHTIDLESNMLREVREETGIDLSQARRDDKGVFIRWGGNCAFFRRYRLDLPAADIAVRIEQFLAREERPELSQIIIASGLDDLSADMPRHTQAFLKHHFGG